MRRGVVLEDLVHWRQRGRDRHGRHVPGWGPADWLAACQAEPWLPTVRDRAAPGQYVTALGLLGDLARAIDAQRDPPELFILDDAVPWTVNQQPQRWAIEVATAIRLLMPPDRQPRVVALTGTAHTAQDMLALLEFGCDDVVKRVTTPYDWEVILHSAAVADAPRGQVALERVGGIEHWPPDTAALDELALQERTRRRLFSDWLRVVALWQDGLHRPADLAVRLGEPEARVLGERESLTRALTGSRKLDRPALTLSLQDRGVLWLAEAAHQRRTAIAWPEILQGTGLPVPTELPPLASRDDLHLARRLYPDVHDPRGRHAAG